MRAGAAIRGKNPAGSGLFAFAAACVLACVACADARAQVTLGHLTTSPANNCLSGSFDVLQVGTAAGDYTAPSDGAITSWSIDADTGADQVGKLKVYRPVEGGFEVVAHSDAETIQAGMNAFKAALAVKAGDEIGLGYTAPTIACAFGTNDAADRIGVVSGDAADGGLLGTLFDQAEAKLNLSATFLPAPTVSAVAPAGGSVSGGTRVTITGANFAEVKAVSFGETPAVSFRVESESQIAAVAPASGTLGETSLTVGTVAGSAAGTFTYRGCLVPRLRGKGLAAAKRLLGQAGCRVGALRTPRGKRARHGRVLRQMPRPATVLPPGAKVSLVLR